jgi:hypothetical protein
MSGSNQSSNLTGMMSQMGGVLATQGDTYRDDMKRNIQNISRPQVKPGDEEGMMRMSNWANKMGRNDEAKNYQKQAETISTNKTAASLAQQEAGFVQSIREAGSTIQGFVDQGKTKEAQQGLAGLQQAALGAQTEGQGRMAQTMISSFKDITPRAEANRVTNTVNELRNADLRVKQVEAQYAESGEEMPENVRQGLEAQKQWKQSMLADADVSNKYNETIGKQLDVNEKVANAKAATNQKAVSPIFQKYGSLMSAKQPERALEAATTMAAELGTPEATDALKDIQVMHKQYTDNISDAANREAIPAAVASLETSITSLRDRGVDVTMFDSQLELIKPYSVQSDRAMIPGEAQGKIDKLWEDVVAQTLLINQQDRANEQAQRQAQTTARTKILDQNLDKNDYTDAAAVVNRAMGEDRSRWDKVFGNLAWDQIDSDVQSNIVRDLKLLRIGDKPYFYKWDNSNPDSPKPALDQGKAAVSSGVERVVNTNSRQTTPTPPVRKNGSKSGYSATDGSKAALDNAPKKDHNVYIQQVEDLK